MRDLRISLPVLNGAVSSGAKVLPKTERTFNDLEGTMGELEQLVDEPSTLISINRLGDFLDEAASLAGYVGPFQTVCNYWNYWFTFLPEHITEKDSVGFSQRVELVGVPGKTSPNEFPRNPLDDYAGGIADGRFSKAAPAAVAGKFDPTVQPITHGNPYSPSGTRPRRTASRASRATSWATTRRRASACRTRRSASRTSRRRPGSRRSARPTSS